MTDMQLDTLEAKGLVKLVAYQPELEYLFRHVLVQDAAYGSLLKQERRQLHRLVGESIEQVYADRASELAGILAMHFELAGDADRAIRYLLADGHYALERNALREAFSAFERARALLPAPAPDEDPATLRQRVEIELGRARAGYSFAEPDPMVADLRATVEPAERLGDLELIWQIHLYIALIQLESGIKATEPSVQHSLKRVSEIGVALDDPSLGALPLALVGLNKVFLGPVREGVEALEKAIPLMEQRRDFIGAAFSRGWLAIGYATLGEFDKADAAALHAKNEAARGDLIAQLDAAITEAMVASLRGELDEALPIAKACVERSQETGATVCAVVSFWVLGDVYQRQGRFDAAREVLQLGYDLAPATGNAGVVWRPTLHAWLGTAQAMLGVSDPADERWEPALATARSVENKVGEAGILWKRGEVRSQAGQYADAIEDFRASAELYREQGARPTLARVLRAWGVALRAAGDQAAGDARLREGLALFEEMGIRREADEVRQLLA
ncbi:MAG TPA: tetratricopeptide repeat protein [Candidatus Limnocylindria bacterium]|nr:tetratricopeptide repeat protein [Candidatus Limnocylindria bacterium]